MKSDDVFDRWLNNGFGTLVDSFSDPAELDTLVDDVLLAGARRRVARRMVSGRAGGPLVANAVVDIARYFRRERPGKVSLHQVCKVTTIAPNAAEEALRRFVLAGVLTETEESGAAGTPSRWYYELTEAGSALMAEVVLQADARQLAGRAVRSVDGIAWEGA